MKTTRTLVVGVLGRSERLGDQFLTATDTRLFGRHRGSLFAVRGSRSVLPVRVVYRLLWIA